MKIYEVGGAVRDYLLGKQPHDIDYVVVGATPKDLLTMGFTQVGKSFPVFLHPETKAEYALARKEIKTGKKHTDFAFDFSANITLEEDLERRDFTCNALAKDLESGKIIDIFGGTNDIKNKILRHINSEHFIEDPLRILRMCRFSAQLDFEIAPETMVLARDMVRKKILNNLSNERIREELVKSLQNTNFVRAVSALKNCEALDFLFPDLSKKLNNETFKQNLLSDLAACKNLEEKAKFTVLFYRYDNEQEIAKECNKKFIPQKFKDFISDFYKYEQYLTAHNTADDEFLFDMLKNTGRLKNSEPAELIFKILQCFGFEQNNNLNRCKIIIKLCDENRVNTMPDFKNLTKDGTIAEKYKEYILQKLSRLK